MVKTMYLLAGSDQESRADFAERIRQLLLAIVENPQLVALKYTITDIAPPMISVIPFSKSLLASISLYQEEYKLTESLSQASGFRGCYQVDEIFPIAYERDWPDGQATPGVNLVTLFKKRGDIDRNTFIDRWHNGHTPLSLKIHPMWNYSRNVVEKETTDRSSPFDGIVEEHFRTRSDLLNPFRFFGNLIDIVPNMLKVYTDVKGFLDYPSIETYLASEYHLMSPKGKH